LAHVHSLVSWRNLGFYQASLQLEPERLFSYSRTCMWTWDHGVFRHPARFWREREIVCPYLFLYSKCLWDNTCTYIHPSLCHEYESKRKDDLSGEKIQAELTKFICMQM
jgi:hypothetical protein